MALAAVTAVSAQPFTFTPGAFEPDLQEAVQRKQSNFTGFVFNFENATVSLILSGTHRPFPAQGVLTAQLQLWISSFNLDPAPAYAAADHNSTNIDICMPGQQGTNVTLLATTTDKFIACRLAED